jgi:RNA polymerase sigma factor (sigma-70 family)
MASPTLADVLQFVRQLACDVEGDGPSDGQLLQRFIAQRDDSAFAAILQRHGPLVFGVCTQVLRNPHDAEDCFQATFLVLARKAAAIRRHESLATWLHRVAFYIASTARTDAVRRMTHERQAMSMTGPGAVGEIAVQDWQPLLHAEVDRLPEKYRIPVVLCYLEGKTHEGAARQLGWPLGTVKGRLARARDLLRTRLAHRGLALSTGTLAMVLSPDVLWATVPPALLGLTLRAARSFAAGMTLSAGAVPARALALAQGAVPIVTPVKLAHAFVLMIVLGVAGLAAVLGLVPGRAYQPDPCAVEGEQTHSRSDSQRLAGPHPLLALRGEQRKGDPIDPAMSGDSLPPGAIARLGTLRFRHGKGIESMVLSPDGKTIVSAGSDGSIVLHDAMTGEKRRSFAGEARYCRVALATDARSLATTVDGKNIAVRETATGNRIREFKVDQEPMYRLAFSADGRILVAGGDHSIRVWDVPSGKEVSRITPPGLETLTLALSPDGKSLATAGWDRAEKPVLCLWETAGGRKLREWQPVADMEETYALAFSPDGTHLASISSYADVEGRGRLRVWAVPTAVRLLELPGRFHELHYSPGGKILAAIEADAVSLREADTGKEIRRIPARGPVTFSSDGKRLALASNYASITLWNVSTAEKLHPPSSGHDHWVRSVQFLSDGETIASLGDDALCFWNSATAERIGRFEDPRIRVSMRTLSPDGKTLATVVWDHSGQAARQVIRLWNTRSGQRLRDLEPSPNASLPALVFSPDARTLAVAEWDGRTIQFWDVASGKLFRKIALPSVSPESLAFTPDGKTLAVADGLYLQAPKDKVPMIRLVDAVTGQ